MNTPNTTKSSQKFVKSQPTTVQSTAARGVVSPGSPQQAIKSTYTWKPFPKESTKPQDFKLHTQERAARRAIFNYTVATKEYIMERQKKAVEKLYKVIEEEEVRMLRKEMIPRAQLMPYFDRPFFPQRSSRPLTVPRQPPIGGKCSSSISCS